MPPKQKMGSITHNSAEVNRGSSKGGMLSKLKGSFTSKPGPASKSNSKRQPPKSGHSSSFTLGSSQQHSTVKCHASSSLTQASSSVTSTDNRGVPTSITALVDAPSVLTDEVMAETGLNHPPPQEFCPPPGRARRRHSLRSYGTTDAASRALGNLNFGGAPMDSSQVPMRRNDLGEWGHRPGGPGQDPGREWGGRHFSHEEMPEPNNTGYNNYTCDHGYDGYYDGCDGRDYYDGRGGGMGQDGGDYYDESGGGIFDNSYMRPSGVRRPSISSHQPPPPNSGYNRSSSHNRRASDDLSQATHDTYMTAPANLGGAPYRRPSQEENFRSNQQPYHHQTEQTDPSMMGYRNPPSGRFGNTAPPDNPRRRVTSDQHKFPPEPGRNPPDDQPRRRTSGDRQNSAGHNSGPTPARNNIVNNTGRDSAISLTSSVKLSGSGRTASGRTASGRNNNPSWFTEQHSDSTDNIQNTTNFHNISSRSRRYGVDGVDDDDRTMTTMATKDQALRPSAMLRAKEKNNPTGDVTIIFTDVQGSTSFWETCPNDMKKATDIHDTLIRQCYTNHSGYEISTEGDSFNLAFQHPVDALAFALQAQLKLYKADWPQGILNHPDGKDEPGLKMRGFRVRFGIHHGPTKSRVHEMTGRNIYSGEGVEVAKAVEGMCHGGQILTTMETWKAVSGMAERYLGRPQVSDCGEHLLFESKTPNGSSGYTTTRYTRRIMQLVPSNLAFDFFEARGRQEVSTGDGKVGFEIKDASSVSGRLFPPLKSKRQLSTCFLNAPYANGRVTICFVYTVGLDDIPDNRSKNLGILAKLIRKKMLSLDPPGYECQEDNGCWMLAFDRMANAVTFGLDVKSAGTEANDLAGTVDREAMFKVGILSGAFTSMGPHKTTGMADYFGPIVNRASRVASNCEPGQVCVGIPLSNGVAADPPDFGPTVRVQLEGIKKLKGITIDMAIFTCTKRRIETPYK